MKNSKIITQIYKKIKKLRLENESLAFVNTNRSVGYIVKNNEIIFLLYRTLDHLIQKLNSHKLEK